MKKSKRRRHIERIDSIVHKILIIRDNGRCQHCLKHAEGQNAHTSHVAPKGRYLNMRFDLVNVILFCFRCHIYWWHKDPIEAGKWFEDSYPARYKYIEETKDDTIGFKDSELSEIEAALKQKLKELTS